MEKGDCIHAPTCLVGGIGPGCSQEGALTCGEALKRQGLTGKPCPFMTGTNGNRKGCDVWQLLVYVPSGADCHEGQKCLIRIIVPEIAKRVACDNGIDGPPTVTNDELKEAGRTIISSRIFVRTESATEKVAK